MPSEIRHILFSKQEVLQALEAFRRVDPGTLPPGKFVDCRVHPDRGLEVVVESAFDPVQPALTRRLNKTTAVRILVSFCIEHRIPLPRAAAKTLAVEGDRLGLTMRLQSAVAAP